jgi:monothiol glutaredoxin
MRKDNQSAMNETLQQQLAELVTSNRVVLFMKGSRDAPKCGFSAKVVQALNSHIPDYETVDVLLYPEVREGIKQFSNWPTLPQLYIDGTFIGGCDIVTELNASGKLEELLSVDPETKSQLKERAIDLSKACGCGGKGAAPRKTDAA